MANINKAELISKVAEHTEMTKKDVLIIFDDIIDTVKETLSSGMGVDIYGFGKLEVKDVAARQARNPKTGEIVEVPAKKAVKFKAAKALKEAVNG